MRPVKSSWPKATLFVPFASELFAGPSGGDNLLTVGAVLARTGDAGCWIVLISAVVVGVGVTWIELGER